MGVDNSHMISQPKGKAMISIDVLHKDRKLIYTQCVVCVTQGQKTDIHAVLKLINVSCNMTGFKITHAHIHAHTH